MKCGTAGAVGVTVAHTNIHLRKIMQKCEWAGDAVIKQDLLTAADGKPCATKL